MHIYKSTCTLSLHTYNNHNLFDKKVIKLNRGFYFTNLLITKDGTPRTTQLWIHGEDEQSTCGVNDLVSVRCFNVSVKEVPVLTGKGKVVYSAATLKQDFKAESD